MIIVLLSIPIGILCFVLSFLCMRTGRNRHAIACAIIGSVFLGAALAVSYGTSILVQGIAVSD